MPNLISSGGTQSWRCPGVLRVKSAVFAGAGAAVALVFFPAWFAIGVAVLFAAWGLGMAVRGAAVLLDPGAGLLVLRMGIITRRVALTGIAAVLVDQAKVSIARSGGGEISLYVWRKSSLDRWLGVPSMPGDIGHAVASAVALAKDAQARELESVTGESAAQAGAPDPRGADQPQALAGTSARSRSALATALLGCTGFVALASAFAVRLSWHNPVMTALGIILAFALGVSGLFYVVFALWLMLARRSASAPAASAPAASAPAGRASAAGT